MPDSGDALTTVGKIPHPERDRAFITVGATNQKTDFSLEVIGCGDCRWPTRSGHAERPWP